MVYRSKKINNRRLFFNFNDDQGWTTFKQLTSEATLLKCIKGLNIEEEGRIWLKKFKNIIYRSFKTIRLKSKNQLDVLHNLMSKKAELVEFILYIKTTQMSENNKIYHIMSYEEEVYEFEKLIADISASRNASTLKQDFLSLSENGNF